MVNQGSRPVIVARALPRHKDWPVAVNLKFSKTNGVDKDRHINLKQLRAVDVSRIRNKQGMFEKRYAEAIQAALSIVFNL